MSLHTRPFRTPLLFHGGCLHLKAENLQRGGSYKIRGVHRFLEARQAQGSATVAAGSFAAVNSGGFATVSAGNLGRALAEACKALQLPCTVYVPQEAPAVKKDRIRRLGATLVEKPFAEIFSMVENPPAEESFLHPLLTPALIEGYGTIADELLEDLPDANALLVPFGLGGLALGLTRRLRALGSKVKVLAAELDLCAPYSAALEAGRPVRVPRIPSFVDAIGTPFVLPYVFAEARNEIPRSVTVSLGETRAALREALLLHGMRLEGAAAVALAAAKKYAGENPGARTIALLSGGNIDPEVFLAEAEAGGLQRAERFASSISLTSSRLSSSS